jgi:cell division GTPase FtsZ
MQVAIVGLGQAGSNIADEAKKLGFLTGAINFSQKDLDSVDVHHKLRLLGSDGVGKNRDEATRLFKDQWQTAASFINDYFSNADLIVFAFSSSGGSGSGISPILLDVAKGIMPDKVFSAIVIMPELTEATTSQINCLSTFSELSSVDVSIFPVDNQQVRNMNPDVGKNKIYELANKTAINLLEKVVSYTNKKSKNGNFDKKDFLNTLNTSGIGTITEVDIATLGNSVNLTPQGVSQKVKDSWNNSVFVPIELNKVTRAAIIFDGQEVLMDHIRHDLMFTDFVNGMPLDLFEGNYHESNGKIISILTGLGWCSKRLNDIEKLINSNKDKVESVLVSQNFYQSDANSLLSKIRKTPEVKKNVTDILNKYIRR